MKKLWLILFPFFLLLASCHSHVVQVKLTNTSSQALSVVVVDYPGATFGVNRLDPGKTYSYPVKPQETGQLKIQFTDVNGKIHNATGPEMHKNDEGTIEVKLDQESAKFE